MGKGERAVALGLIISTLAALGLAGVYMAGGQPQAEGALLAVALGALGYALVVWARDLLGESEVTAERGELGSSEEDEEAAEEATAVDDHKPSRRKLLALLGASVGGLSLAAVFPVRSLGPNPGDSLSRTAWRPGRRLIDQDGRLVRVDTLAIGGTLTVFPEGEPDAGDSQVVLVRVEPTTLRPRRGRQGWAPEGNVAYSKICPHVGCPVGLYQVSTQELVCPCHQSTFDVLDGARPRFGPATRSLPQLPLAIDPEGFLVAQSDFHEPVGPAFWNRG